MLHFSFVMGLVLVPLPKNSNGAMPTFATMLNPGCMNLFKMSPQPLILWSREVLCSLNSYLIILSNDANEVALVDTVFNYNIKNDSKTENIPKVSQSLSAITDTIMAICDHKENSPPDDYVQHLIKIFQTTSVEAFNQTFAKLEDDATYTTTYTPTSFYLFASTIIDTIDIL